MAHAWNACWVNALRGSNPLSSAVGSPRDHPGASRIQRRESGRAAAVSPPGPGRIRPGPGTESTASPSVVAELEQCRDSSLRRTRCTMNLAFPCTHSGPGRTPAHQEVVRERSVQPPVGRQLVLLQPERVVLRSVLAAGRSAGRGSAGSGPDPGHHLPHRLAVDLHRLRRDRSDRCLLYTSPSPRD